MIKELRQSRRINFDWRPFYYVGAIIWFCVFLDFVLTGAPIGDFMSWFYRWLLIPFLMLDRAIRYCYEAKEEGKKELWR